MYVIVLQDFMLLLLCLLMVLMWCRQLLLRPLLLHGLAPLVLLIVLFLCAVDPSSLAGGPSNCWDRKSHSSTASPNPLHASKSSTVLAMDRPPRLGDTHVPWLWITGG